LSPVHDEVLTLQVGSKMAFRNRWSRPWLRDLDAPARFGALVWRRARWGFIFYRSKYWRDHEPPPLEGAYRQMRERLFDERQLASEALYWATVRDRVETTVTTPTLAPDSTPPDDLDVS
jgi:hypothetical protein